MATATVISIHKADIDTKVIEAKTQLKNGPMQQQQQQHQNNFPLHARPRFINTSARKRQLGLQQPQKQTDEK